MAVAILEGLVLGAVFVAWTRSMARLERRIGALNELRRVTTIGYALRDALPPGSLERRAVQEAFLTLDVEGATGSWEPTAPPGSTPLRDGGAA
jgi:hypothetical protein